MRDKVPSPPRLQTLSVEIISEAFNAVWWAVSQSRPWTSQQTKANLKKRDFKASPCLDCLMESSKIENLICVGRRLDQAENKVPQRTLYPLPVRRERLLLGYVWIYKGSISAANAVRHIKRGDIFRFDNHLSARNEKCYMWAWWYICLWTGEYLFVI